MIAWSHPACSVESKQQTCSLHPVLVSVIQAVTAAPQDYAAWDIGAQSLQTQIPLTVSLFHIFRKLVSGGFCPSSYPSDASHQGNGSVSSGPLVPLVRLQMLMALSWLSRCAAVPPQHGGFHPQGKLQL